MFGIFKKKPKYKTGYEHHEASECGPTPCLYCAKMEDVKSAIDDILNQQKTTKTSLEKLHKMAEKLNSQTLTLAPTKK